MGHFNLENDTLRLTFDDETGALTGLVAVETGWRILDRPHLGLSFRLLAPLPDRRNNPVHGERQSLSTLTVADDRRGARLTWDGVQSQHGGRLDIGLTLEITLSARQALFALTVDNRSPLTIEAAYCPYLGDVQHPPDGEWLKGFVYRYATADEWPMWPRFENMRGYYGVDYPVQFASWGAGSGAPMSPYILLRGPRQGLYVGVAEPSAELVAWHAELRPGYGEAIDSQVPRQPTIGGHDVATRFAAVHMPFVAPGERRALTPVALEAYQGGWQAGVDIYKAWRDGWMETPSLPGWVREPHAWQQLHINSPEDELRIPFRDLPQVGETCARHGVKAIQLVGWEVGGQDRGNPDHDPDPRLGAFQELRDAIAAIQAMGVKVVLFCKYTWADRSTDRFRDDLVRLAIKDPYGDTYHYGGYQYQTATQLLDINTRRLIPMCFLADDYLALANDEFRKVLDLGADGILFDECLHHSPALLCFDESHGHRRGAMVYANDRKLIETFAAQAAQRDTDFLFAGEACYDWEFEAYHASYHRSWEKDHIPLSRYMLPHVPLLTAITGFNDRHMINQCLLYRYIISYEPFNFKGSLDDYPETVAYGRQMDALRSELRALFWDGEFRHEVGASVTVDGEPHHPYAVFIDRATGQRGLVIVNYDDEATITATAALDDGGALSRYRLVDDAQWRPVKAGIQVPPASAAVVLA